MKNILVTLAMLVIYTTGFAQLDKKVKIPPTIMDEYYMSMPPYGLNKVNKLVEKISGTYGADAKLPEKVYASLSLREKFTYNMIHYEVYSQICSQRPGHEPGKLYSSLPSNSEYQLSRRQQDFFSNNRDSVVALMTECIKKYHRVGLNFKEAIGMIHAPEMIPLLIDTYNFRTDHDILTVLMNLMAGGKYAPFMATHEYRNLYEGKDSFWGKSIPFNSAVETLVLQHAANFFKTLPKKS